MEEISRETQAFIIGAWQRCGYSTGQIAKVLNHLENREFHSENSIRKLINATNSRYNGVWRYWEAIWRYNNDIDFNICNRIRDTMEEVLRKLDRNPNWCAKYDRFMDESKRKWLSKQLKSRPRRRTEHNYPSTLGEGLRLIVARIDTEQQSAQPVRVSPKSEASANSTISESTYAVSDKANDNEGLDQFRSTLGKRKRGVCFEKRMKLPPLAIEAWKMDLGERKPGRSPHKRLKPNDSSAQNSMTSPDVVADDKEESPKRHENYSFERRKLLTLPKLAVMYPPFGKSSGKAKVRTRPPASEIEGQYDAWRNQVASNLG